MMTLRLFIRKASVRAVALVVTALLFSPQVLSAQNVLPANVNRLIEKGNHYAFMSNYKDAAVFYEQAEAMIEDEPANEDNDWIIHLIREKLATCYEKMSEYDKAIACYQFLGRLRETGRCHFKMGNYVMALKCYQEASDNNNSSDAWQDFAKCYQKMGEYAKAIDYYKQVLAYYYQQVSIYSLDKFYTDRLYQVLNDIGDCYNDLGNHDEAVVCYQLALGIFISCSDNANEGAVFSLAQSYYRIGDYLNALEFYKRALDLYKRERTGYDNVETYDEILRKIGDCYGLLGNLSLSLRYHRLVLELRANHPGKTHPDYAASLFCVGRCQDQIGAKAEALEYFTRALDIWEMALGRENPDYATCILSIGQCHFDVGDYADASEYLSSYVQVASSIVKNTFMSLTERERMLFWDKYREFFTNLLYDFSTHIANPEMNCTAYDGSLLGKSLLLNAETEMRKLILESGDEEALRIYNEVQQSRIRLDKIYEDPVGKKEQIDSLNNDIEVRQQELMKRSKAFGDYTRNLALKWTDVQAALGKKDIAIEFETYTHKDTTFYIALTLRPGYTEPHLVELFNSTQIKAKSDSKTYYTSTAMSKLVWGNLAEELNGVKNVYFSPAGELNNIGIEYMLDVDGEDLLSEKRNYYRLTSTRELAKEHQAKTITDATVYGGIRYDVTPGSKLTGEETESERLALSATRSYTPADSLSVTRGGWNYLPGTKEEAESISSTLSSKRVKNELLEGEDGTEESFKALGGAKKDVIHIATHGFYWTETEVGRSGMETSSFMLSGESRAPKEDKALTRSGLLFAGAQNAFDGKEIPIDVEDGILTAKDISRMDLRGTDLVVISACQSGLGEVTGDGVFGLQRGFKKAGVQSIVMSLWEVDDTATKIMMTRFYENLAKGKSKYDSFHDAQKYLRKYDDGIYDDPEYYAAFVLLDAIK